MSEVMMGVLQRQVESLTRSVEKLGPENERVRKLLTEFDHRHDRDQAEIERLKAALVQIREAHPTGTSYTHMNDGTWREACRDLQRIARLAVPEA